MFLLYITAITPSNIALYYSLNPQSKLIKPSIELPFLSINLGHSQVTQSLNPSDRFVRSFSFRNFNF